MIGLLLSAAMAAEPSWMRSVWTESGGQLEVAARAWRADAEGPTVWLVGVTHLGEPGYYEDIRTLLDACDVVVFESVLPEAAAPPGGEDEAERAESTRATAALIAEVFAGQDLVEWNQAIAQAAVSQTPMVSIIRPLSRDGWGRPWVVTPGHIISRGADGKVGGVGAAADIVVEVSETPQEAGGGGLQRTMAESLGLQFQIDSLPYADRRWIPGDMRIDEVAAAFQERGQDVEGMLSLLSEDGFFGGVLSGVLKMIPLADALFGGRVVDTLRVLMIEMLGDEALVHGTLDRQAPAVREVLIDLRNERAMDVVRHELGRMSPDQSIALIYGAGHLPGLMAMLEGDGGWTHVEARWMPAINIDLSTSPLTSQEVGMLRGWITAFGARMMQ